MTDDWINWMRDKTDTRRREWRRKKRNQARVPTRSFSPPCVFNRHRCISSRSRSFINDFVLVRYLIKRIMSIMSNYINYFISSLEFKNIDIKRERMVINDSSVEKSIFYPARFAWHLSSLSRECPTQDMMEHE